MWVQELPMDFMKKKSLNKDTIFIWKSDNHPIYVMDNHLAAAWCWMQECNPNEEYNFMHIDKHSDLKGCGTPSIIDFIKKNPKISFEEYKQITYTNPNTHQFFQWDNYIRACHYLFPNWFNANFFYTHTCNKCESNNWGYDAFPSQTRNPFYVRQDLVQIFQELSPYLHGIPKNTIKKERKWILNIDLDFFWDFNKIKVFSDDFIRNFAQIVNNSMQNVQVLTIAVSPDCIGGSNSEEIWKNANHLLQIFNDEIQNLNFVLFD